MTSIILGGLILMWVVFCVVPTIQEECEFRHRLKNPDDYDD
jgi:hypothetical protein